MKRLAFLNATHYKTGMRKLKNKGVCLFLLLLMSAFLFETVALPVHAVGHALSTENATSIEGQCQLCLGLHNHSPYSPPIVSFLAPRFETPESSLLERVYAETV